MRLVLLLTSLQGRISRASWWLGLAAVFAAAILGSLVIDPRVWFADPPRPPSPLLALWDLILVVPMTAVSIKRFNDRDRPPWFGLAMGVLGAAMILAEQLGFMVDPTSAPLIHHVVLWCIVAVFVLALIDNGFLRGTIGPNRYGADPLPANPPTA